jgi:cytochrome c peroxidase
MKNSKKYLWGLIGGCTTAIILVACDNSENFPTPKGQYPLDQLPAYFGKNFQIPADNPLTYEGVELGRMLFYEKKLSANNQIACASCHQQSKAFTDGLAVSVGVEGRKREVGSMSLANLLWQKKFNWNGSASNLEEQVVMPMQHPNEMNQSLEISAQKLQATDNYPQKFKEVFKSEQIIPQNIAKALAQFLRTLISANSKFDKVLRGETQLTESEQRGRVLFFTHPIAGQLRGGNCGDCHGGLMVGGTAPDFQGFHNNGLETDANLKNGLFDITKNPNDKGKFKAPSLRNIALTAPYMHDGRFQSLEEVLDHYNEHIKMSSTLDVLITEASNNLFVPPNTVDLGLTAQEKADIIAFLKTLTDEEFVNNPKFKQPQ